MAYPRPIPPLDGKASKEFEANLKEFALTAEQKRFFAADTDKKPFQSRQ